MKTIKIRRATLDDTAALSGLKVRAWQWGYRGLLPEDFLDTKSADKTEAFLREQLALDHPRHTWIAEIDGEPLGFVTCGPTVDSSLPPDTGEIFSMYQEARSEGTGLGRALLSFATDDLTRRGFTTAVLWVLETNRRARRFYEIAGWGWDGARKEEEQRANHVRHKVRYRSDLL
jgi:ribosomal protein S18 acetylase RimI-like enzyme